MLRAMKYRRFGRTEIQMPVFSCGGMRYQFKWQDVAPSEIPAEGQANLEATIHRALELGINHIETARGYGTSEMQLGAVLPQLPRDKIIALHGRSLTAVGRGADQGLRHFGVAGAGKTGSRCAQSHFRQHLLRVPDAGPSQTLTTRTGAGVRKP